MNGQELTDQVSPDLQIFVHRNPPSELTFNVRSARLRLHDRDFGSLRLEGDTKALAQDELGRQMDRLSDLSAKGEQGQENARKQLADIAATLFMGLPPLLRELLWSNLGQLETLQVLSAEPYFPWELLKLQSEGGESGPFLCEAFSVTRWLPDVSQVILSLPLQNIAFVRALEDGLPSAAEERADLVALVGEGRVVDLEPTFDKVAKALGAGDFDGWHFAGHGSAKARDPNRAELLLAGDDFLTPANLAPARANFLRFRPLVFLNGCNTGRSGYSLTGVGGWAQQSLQAGAGAFIGSLWSVRDQKARQFAHSFYRSFLGGRPLGESVRRARRDLRDQFPGDPAWLAYTVYGEPGALCSPESGELKGERSGDLGSVRVVPVMPSRFQGASARRSTGESRPKDQVEGSFRRYGVSADVRILIRRLQDERYEIIRSDCTCVGIFFGSSFLGSFRNIDSQQWGIIRGSFPRQGQLVLHFFDSNGFESIRNEIWLRVDQGPSVLDVPAMNEGDEIRYWYLIGGKEADPLTIIGKGRGLFLPETSYWRGVGIFDGHYYLGVYRYTAGVENWGWDLESKAKWLDVWGRHEGRIREKGILDVHGKDLMGVENSFRTAWFPVDSPMASEEAKV